MIAEKDINEHNIFYENNSSTLAENFKFAGESLKNWISYFDIEIPKDPDYKDLETLYIELSKRYSVAQNNSILAYGVYTFSKRTLEKQESIEYVKLYNNPDVKKTALSVEKTVSHLISKEEDNLIVAKYIYDFWVEQLKFIERKQKLVESISWSIRNQQGII